MNINFFASVLHLTRLYSVQMRIVELTNAYVKIISDSGGNFQICQ